MQLKRLVFFLLINVIVSALTTLIVLTIWDRSHRTETVELANSTSEVIIPTATQVTTDPEPTISLQAYQVAAGETLGEIALDYDITVEELLDLNGLSDPDSIGAGTIIFVPALEGADPDDLPDNSVAEGEAESENTPSPTNTGLVEIVAVIGAGDLASERVQLRGLGEMTLSLTRWRLHDEDSNEYTFPQITLFGNGAVDIYSGAGVDTVVALFWNSNEAVWESSETVTLVDDAGNIQAIYTVP
jgi:LysM repeat protein